MAGEPLGRQAAEEKIQEHLLLGFRPGLTSDHRDIPLYSSHLDDSGDNREDLPKSNVIIYHL